MNNVEEGSDPLTYKLMKEISKVYRPKEVEDKWYGFWEENNYFQPEMEPTQIPYVVSIPPPNITGILHMGHALNNTLQDILIRWKRMEGVPTLWVPGTDHAGIATQNVVEKDLAKEGLKKEDIGREKFLQRLWAWRDEYGSTIISQLRKLGSSCDWQRTRFTMDEEYYEAVIEVFIQLWKKKLIYQGDYIINWCPRCKTALSDEEAPYEEREGFLYYIKYPIKDSDDFLTVATTRPETMLGDVAVAVSPKDKRYKSILGKIVILPLMEREIKVITDDLVDPEFGTGAVKVTPAHDHNDFQMGNRHKLSPLLVMNPDGTMNENAGEFRGLDRFEAREAIIESLKERKLISKIEPHSHTVGHCYRCNTIIEPYLSRQWFVKLKQPIGRTEMVARAIRAVENGEIKFYPKRWTKVYLNWMENIRDWCISRQIWWGHRIPVYYCRDCKKEAIAAKEKPNKCRYCDSTNLKQDESVLDTWFSSWLWPFATLGWPKQTEDLKYFYPTSTLVTAQEIIFFWVARMIMAGLEFAGKIPFKDVYIHGTVRDEKGKKMSKSLGNIIDPLDIIEEFGTDALRFSIISITATGQDVFLSKEKFTLGRNFANKIWNASRFVLMSMREPVPSPSISLRTGTERPIRQAQGRPEQAKRVEGRSRSASSQLPVSSEKDLSLADRWCLSRLNRTTESVTRALEGYRFNEAANMLYEFFWHQFCDWYLELAKPEIEKERVRGILIHVLEATLRLLHPFMPFVSEEIWQMLPHEGPSIMVAPWPKVDRGLIDGDCEREMDLIMKEVTAIRNMRSDWEVPPSKRVEVAIRVSTRAQEEILKGNLSYIEQLAKASVVEIARKLAKPAGSVTTIVEGVGTYVRLRGLIDMEKERARLSRDLEEVLIKLERVDSKLKKKGFIKKAPLVVIEKEKEKRKELKEKRRRLEAHLGG